MKRNLSTPLKASFLLIVFSMKMTFGFVRAIGIDIPVSLNDHNTTKAVTLKRTHHHDLAGIFFCKLRGCKSKGCDKHVIKFLRVDKSVPQCFAGINPFFTTLTSFFYSIDVLHTSKALASIKYFVRSYHPPIPDIRVAILSFQV